MSLAVDEPILTTFEKPKEYWVYEEGHPKRMLGRVSQNIISVTERELMHKLRCL